MLRVAAASACAAAVGRASSPPTDAVAALWGAASHLPAPGSVGALSVFGPRAAPVAVGNQSGSRAPFAAAVEAGGGRAVALAHDGYLTQAPRDAAIGAFLLRTVRWAGRSDTGSPMRVALRAGGGLDTWMAAAGFKIVPWKDMDRADVLIAVGRSLGDSDISPIVSLVERGGGLVVAETAGSWNCRGRPLTAHPANQLFARWGVVWTDGIVEPDDAERFAKVPVDLCHALNALEAMLAADGRATADMRHTEATLTSALRWTPPGDTLFRPRLDRARGSRVRSSVTRAAD